MKTFLITLLLSSVAQAEITVQLVDTSRVHYTNKKCTEQESWLADILSSADTADLGNKPFENIGNICDFARDVAGSASEVGWEDNVNDACNFLLKDECQ